MKNPQDKSNVIRKESVKYSLFGLATALLMFSILVGPFEAIGFIFIFLPSFGVGIFSMILLINLSAKILSQANTNRFPPILIGITIALISFYGGAFLGSASGYFVDGMKEDHGIMDYVYKPFLAMFVYGSIPALILGFLLGFRLKNKLQGSTK